MAIDSRVVYSTLIAGSVYPARRTWCFFCAVLLSGFSSFGYASGWSLEPGIESSITHSDNVLLSSGLDNEEPEVSDTFLMLQPGFSAVREGGKSNAVIRYRAQSYFFSGNDEWNNTEHQMDTRVSGWSDSEIFKLDIAATYSQQLIDPRERLRNSDYIESDNETDVATYRVMPEINYEADSGFVFNTAYQAVEVDYSEDEDENVSDTSIDGLRTYIGSADRSFLFGGARYKQDEIEYENAIRAEFKSASLEMGFNIGAATQLIAEAGEERNEYVSEDDAVVPEGSFWKATLNWSPSVQNRIELSFGERYFGNTGSFLWHRTGSRFRMGAEYTEKLQTEAQAFIDRPINFNDNFITSGLSSPSTEVFLSKYGSMFIGYRFSKTEFRLASDREQREFQGEGIDEIRNGRNLTWQWAIWPRSTLDVRYSDTRFKYEEGIDDVQDKRSAISFNRQIGTNANGGIMFGRNNRKSEVANLSYVENLVSVSFSVIF